MVTHFLAVGEASKKNRIQQWEKIQDVFKIEGEQNRIFLKWRDEVLRTIAGLKLDQNDFLIFSSVRCITPIQCQALKGLYDSGVRIAFASPVYASKPLDSQTCISWFDFYSTHKSWYYNVRGRTKKKTDPSRFKAPYGRHTRHLIRETEVDCWKEIYAKSRAFKGVETDAVVIEDLGLSVPTYYNYKRHLREFIAQGGEIDAIDWRALDAMSFTKNKYYKKNGDSSDKE